MAALRPPDIRDILVGSKADPVGDSSFFLSVLPPHPEQYLPAGLFCSRWFSNTTHSLIFTSELTAVVHKPRRDLISHESAGFLSGTLTSDASDLALSLFDDLTSSYCARSSDLQHVETFESLGLLWFVLLMFDDAIGKSQWGFLLVAIDDVTQ